ncbi:MULTISPECIES: gliding motility protein [Streptomyces]|uniref:gliding motility protein n=1 Tax=Streptomyces TaxID=1883 RepID=UPI0021AF67C9|nr:gliding motility protein [Streptomyces sp. WAC07061]
MAEPAAAEAGTAEALDAKTEPAVGAEEVAEVGEAGSAAAGTAAAEAVEIPKQQSVEAAADSGAGEGART